MYRSAMYRSDIPPPNYIRYDPAGASSAETTSSERYSYYSTGYQSAMTGSPKRHPRRASYTSAFTSPPYTSSSYTKALHDNSPYTLSPYANTETSYTSNQCTPATSSSFERRSTYQSTLFNPNHDTVKSRKTFTRDTRVDASASYPIRSRDKIKDLDKETDAYRLRVSAYRSASKSSEKTTNHDIPAGYSFERRSTYQSTPFNPNHDTVESGKTFARDTEVDASASSPKRSRRKVKALNKEANVPRREVSPYSSVSKSSEKTTNHGIPAGYSLRNWDPTEEPTLLLGSVFDANSLGKWIYDWTVSKHGLLSPMADLAGDLWLHLEKLTSLSKPVRPITRQLSRHGKVLGMFSLGSLLKVVSALPVDPGESTSSSSGRPGGLDLLGWPSPCLGIVFAAAATFFSRPHSTSRVPGAMALVFNYLGLVASGDATATPAVLWT